MQPYSRKRSKGGRPRIAPESVRGRTVGVCVNAAELDALRRYADSAGLSVSEWIRRVALSRYTPRPIMPEVNRKTYLELARIGGNLNQLTMLAHSGSFGPIDALLAEVITILRQTQRELCGGGDDSETR